MKREQSDQSDIDWANGKARQTRAFSDGDLVATRDLTQTGRVVKSMGGSLRVDFGSSDANMVEVLEDDLVFISDVPLTLPGNREVVVTEGVTSSSLLSRLKELIK